MVIGLMASFILLLSIFFVAHIYTGFNREVVSHVVFGTSRDSYGVTKDDEIKKFDSQGFIDRVRASLRRTTDSNVATTKETESIEIKNSPESDTTISSDLDTSEVSGAQEQAVSTPHIGGIYVCAETATNAVENIQFPHIPTVPIFTGIPQCISESVIGVLHSGSFIYRGENIDTNINASNTDGSFGYARDGFGVYGSIENGVTISNSNLDVCHGHTHEILQNGVATNVYHYHITNEYPYSIGCFMGTVSQ